MRFEGEEAPEQRFTGTIVGIEDGDPKRWRESKWRCLKVKWDETSTIPRPERVSPWSIEPALAPPALNALPMPRPKRPRSNMVPSSPDSSVLTREGSSKVTFDPQPPSGYLRVLQGQEFQTLRGNFAECNESDTVEKSVVWPSSLEDEKVDSVSASSRHGSDWILSGGPKPACTDLLSGFGTHVDSSHRFGAHIVDQTSTAASRKLVLEQEGKFNLLASPWSLMSSGLSLKLSDSNTKVPEKDCDMAFEARGNIRCSAFNEYAMLNGHRVEQSHGNWLMPPPPSHFDNHAHARELGRKPILVREHEIGKSTDGKCKLFGIRLFNNPVMPESAASHRNLVDDPMSCIHPQSHQLHVLDSDRSEQSKGSKMADENEYEKQLQAGLLHTSVNQSKVQSVSTRSCTKVHKQGIVLGRSVDLTKFNNYDELIAELDRLFEFDGELMAPKKNWLIVYTDDEGDMMLVGDDPWQEFVGMVRKIFIYTREEVQKMNPGTLNSKGDENLLDAEGMDAKELKCLPLPPVHNTEIC